MKNVLVVSYSQTGQLDQILDNFLVELKDAKVERKKIELVKPFPFPWDTETFFDIMPETVLEEPIEIHPLSFERDSYDLIIIGYQPWFLSPSMPTTALFHRPEFTNLIKGTAVMTVIGARNMWINSQISLVKKIEDLGGTMVANVPYIDKVQNHVSALTILHWLGKGKKTRRWGFFPLPGVSDKDIQEAGNYAVPVNEALKKDSFLGLQENILALGGISIESSIMLIESRAIKLFHVWANLIKSKGTTPEKRRKWVGRFHAYLVIALFVISPPIVIIHYLLSPLLLFKIRRNRKKYLYLGIDKSNG